MTLRRIAAVATSIVLFFSAVSVLNASKAIKPNIKGCITSDGRPMPGVQVSDGHSIVTTDAKGRYSIVSDKKDSMVFITVPSGYRAELTDGIRPRFWAKLTEPAGKCEKHDFRLEKENQDNYSVLFVTDLHLGYIGDGTDTVNFRKNVLPNIVQIASENSKGPVYSFNLGDFSHDSKWYENNFNGQDAYDFIRRAGYPVPMFFASGNHDNDGSIIGEDADMKGAWMIRRVWGPDRFSVNIGNDHWICLDDIIYNNTPLEKEKYKNIKGNRDYITGLKPSQLEWLAKDVAAVPDGTNIYVCMHCPVFNTANTKETIPEEQTAILDKIFQRFDKVTIFGGHAHMMHIPSTGKYSRFEQYVLPAASGSMWQTDARGFESMSGDGTPAGIFYGVGFTSGTPQYHYRSHQYGETAMYVYDMNKVGAEYRNDADLRFYIKEFKDKGRHDYGSEEFRDMIFANYWWYRPGETVHMYENGVELEVRMDKYEDPRYVSAFTVPEAIKAKGYKKSLKGYRAPHMFVAKANTPDAPVLIQVTDSSGKVVREQLFRRQ